MTRVAGNGQLWSAEGAPESPPRGIEGPHSTPRSKWVPDSGPPQGAEARGPWGRGSHYCNSSFEPSRHFPGAPGNGSPPAVKSKRYSGLSEGSACVDSRSEQMACLRSHWGSLERTKWVNGRLWGRSVIGYVRIHSKHGKSSVPQESHCKRGCLTTV